MFRGHSEHGSQGFYFLLRFYAIMLPSLSANSASLFTLFLWPLNRIFSITQFHSIYNGSGSLPSFLNTLLVSSIFPLCGQWNTFFHRISLPLYHSFIQGCFFLPSFENFPIFVLSPKIQKSCFFRQLRKKTQWNKLYLKQLKWTYQIYLGAERSQQIS